MKKLLLSLALAVTAALPLSATEYTFGNYDLSITGSGPLTLQLGFFGAGFSPSGANASDWLANWTTEPGSDGYYDPSVPEWAVKIAPIDNSVFAQGQQLYLWAFDTQAGLGSSWALFTDASWTVGTNITEVFNDKFLDFTSASVALFGSLNLAGGSASTSIVSAAAVPDAGATVMLLGLGLAGLAALRPRRLARVAV